MALPDPDNIDQKTLLSAADANVTQSQQHGSPGISQRRVSGSAGDGYGLHYPLDYPERLKLMIYRRSADAELFRKQRYALPIEETMAELLRQEDLDGDCLITIEDGGPKSFTPRVNSPDRADQVTISGNYPLASLLQELFLAKRRGETELILDPDTLTEDPVIRIERFIKEIWWDSLTRQMDEGGIVAAARDPKLTTSRPRIYVPSGAPEQHAYYRRLAADRPDMNLDVHFLPQGDIDPEFIKSLNTQPGILALEMEKNESTGGLGALPLIVPGDRFNELYNWDSVFASWGLVESHPNIVKSIIKHFAFEIKHYGKVLNANRTYYLGRAQPPFLTDLALRNYHQTKSDPGALDLLKTALLAAMKEYHSYWMTSPRYDEETGLSRYRPIGAGLPPECEPTQFDHVLAPYASKYDLSTAEVMEAYNDGKIREPDLDTFCLHDRAVRESGHDVSRRVEGVCADLATIDLNALLYKYETDFAHIIHTFFDDNFKVTAEFATPGREAGSTESPTRYKLAAQKRKNLIDKYLWNEEEGMYFDYNTRTKQQTTFESATTFWALWSGLATPHQASLLVRHALPKLERIGGLSASTAESRGPVDNDIHPQLQWDYPFGWPPHQLLAWEGLKRYGFNEGVERLVYKWLYMITRVFVDFNGTVVEKYDVTQRERPHRVEAEYGNQGLNFKYAPLEGFGWTNGSYIVGLSLLSPEAKRALGVLSTYEEYMQSKKQ